jgi:large subunit ribosomal protein L11
MEKIKATIKLILQSGLANPGPPIGPALGSYGINLQTFCKNFNEKSLIKTNDKKGIFMTVVVKVFENKQYNLLIKGTPVSFLIKEFLNLTKGSKEPKKQIIGILSKEDLKKLVYIKKDELNTFDEIKARNIIIGTALSMGIRVAD